MASRRVSSSTSLRVSVAVVPGAAVLWVHRVLPLLIYAGFQSRVGSRVRLNHGEVSKSCVITCLSFQHPFECTEMSCAAFPYLELQSEVVKFSPWWGRLEDLSSSCFHSVFLALLRYLNEFHRFILTYLLFKFILRFPALLSSFFLSWGNNQQKFLLNF